MTDDDPSTARNDSADGADPGPSRAAGNAAVATAREVPQRPPAGPPDPGDVLARYSARMRRQRTIYYAVVAVIVVAAGAFVAVLWSRGEAAHASLHTVARPPADLVLGTPSSTLQVAWRSSDHVAIGTQPYRGTVVTYGKRTVRGRDARTGKQTWSYTRTDRTLCSAAQLGGVTIATYNLNGNCDQVSAFASDTGARRWTRTLDIDGQPLNGHPTFQTTNGTWMVTSPKVIYAIDPSSGLNRWTYSRVGCRINAAVLGTAGALVSQTCVHPRCGNLKFCSAGVQLFLRQREAGNGDDSKADRDQFRWNRRGDADLPVSAGAVVSALDPSTRRLTTLNPDKGTPSAVDLSPAPGSTSVGVPAESGDGQLIWIGGTAYALAPGETAQLWSTSTATAPTVVATDDADPSLASSLISAAVSGGLAELDASTGDATRRFAVPAPGRDGLVTPMGTGFLVSGGSGASSVVAYR